MTDTFAQAAARKIVHDVASLHCAWTKQILGPADQSRLEQDWSAIIARHYAPLHERDRQLGNLLVIFNRDGGHYQAEHGVDAAIQKAQDDWHKLREAADGMRERVARIASTNLDDAEGVLFEIIMEARQALTTYDEVKP